MSEELWVVRAGRDARFVDEFLENSAITIAFREFASDDLSATDEAALRSRAGPPAERAHAGRLVALAYTMDVGDLVIVPRLTAAHRDYLVARTTGPYQHVPKAPGEQLKGSGNHRRSVEWLGSFTQDSVGTTAKMSLAGRQTLFRPSAGELDLRARIKALDPIAA